MVLELIYQKTNIFLLYSRLFSTGLATVIALDWLCFFPSHIKFLRRFGVSSEFQSKRDVLEPVMPAGILFIIIVLITALMTVRFNSYVISGLSFMFFSELSGPSTILPKLLINVGLHGAKSLNRIINTKLMGSLPDCGFLFI